MRGQSDDMTIRVDYSPGRLPIFWDRSVVFFANLLALFYGNEGATQELAARVGGIETYGGRLCPLINLLFAGSENLLVLESQPDECLLDYFSQQLGLDLPETRAAVLESLVAAISQTANVAAVTPPFPDDPQEPAAFLFQVVPASSPQDAETDELVFVLRDEVIPSFVDGTSLDDVSNLEWGGAEGAHLMLEGGNEGHRGKEDVVVGEEVGPAGPVGLSPLGQEDPVPVGHG